MKSNTPSTAGVRQASARMRGPRRRWRSRRGVSEVVATILLLALTVVLFSSIFAFVTSFPAPPAQNADQFQARLIILPNASGGGGTITGISILHLAGPQVSAQALIYMKSAIHPTWLQFSVPYSLTAGGIPAGQVWSLGQTWLLTSFTGGADSYAPDNISIYIVAADQLLFSAVVPGAVLNLPPTFLAVGTSPASPAVGQAFTISAVIQGVIPSNTVLVTLSGLPGLSLVTVPQPLNFSNGQWTTFLPAGHTTASGSYYVFLTATSSTGKMATSALPVSITPYTTLIATAFSVGAVTIGGAKCTAAAAPVAACRASLDYYATVAISTSSITFGSVLFEVYTTATGVAYITATHAAFAISPNAPLTTVDASWVPPAVTGPLLVTPTWTTTYAASFSSVSPLTNQYTISIDLGTVAPGVNTLSFIVLGTGAYSGSTPPVIIP